MQLSRRVRAVVLFGWVLTASACSNLTAPAGEDPDSLPPVADKAATAGQPGQQPRKLPDTRPQNRAKGTEATVRRILIAYKGADGAKPGVERSKDDAQKLAIKVAGELNAPNANFAALAKKHSDAPDAARGGMLPAIKRDSDVDPILKSAAFRTPVGKISGVLNTKQGFLILQRLR